ncbi:MAG: PilZ domain-containing protein [Candidatus Omnitrophota bacterium]
MEWSGIDARKSVRVSFECVVKVKKRGPKLVLESMTENISMGGICVILEKPLLKGAYVVLEIHLPDDLPFVECEGRVAWSVKRDEYSRKKLFQFNTGIEFIEISDQDRTRVRHIIDEMLEY